MGIAMIVGLGNPGTRYHNTRHNAGFWYVIALAQHYGIHLSLNKKFAGLVGQGNIDGCRVRLLLPQTFMNDSGRSVVPMARFFGVANEQLLIAHDELDIPAGRIKLKTGGGHGGHNGLRDITPRVGNDFHRLRIGIGHPGHKSKVTAHVLGAAPNDEQIAIESALHTALTATPKLVVGDIEQARGLINAYQPPSV